MEITLKIEDPKIQELILQALKTSVIKEVERPMSSEELGAYFGKSKEWVYTNAGRYNWPKQVIGGTAFYYLSDVLRIRKEVQFNTSKKRSEQAISQGFGLSKELKEKMKKGLI
jgi:hypothetical protein